jgi:hypothetical protein
MTIHRVNKTHEQRIRQGDIFPNLPYYESFSESKGDFELTVYEFPYSVVLTQDCDLEQNKSARSAITPTDKSIYNDKHLISVIVAPLYNSEHLFAGEHLKGIDISSQKLNSDLRNPVKKNQNPRYHYIEFDDSVVLPNSVVDFKHYFTVSLSLLEKLIDTRLCGLDPLYRELLSQRFSNYLSRIGLPTSQ